jgi:RNA polymerase sigma factor (sigma-70 family)
VDEEELIQAAKDGRAHAGPFLVSLYAPALLGHVRAFAHDLGDTACEDICENAVERAVRKIDLFDPSRGSFASWTRSMVRYAAADYRRDHERLQEFDEGTRMAPAVAEPRAEITPDVHAALTDAVRSLRPADQAILALRDAEGLSVAAVASRLGITEDAVRQRHLRARRRLGTAGKDDPRLATYAKGAPR